MKSRKNLMTVLAVIVVLIGCVQGMDSKGTLSCILPALLYLCVQGRKDELNAAIRFNNTICLSVKEIRENISKKNNRGKQPQLYASAITSILPVILKSFEIEMPPEAIGLISGAIAIWLGLDRKHI